MKTKNSSLFRRATTAAFVATALAFTYSAQAQKSWTGGCATNSSWNVGANWNGSSVPVWGNTMNLTIDVAASTQSYFGNAIPIVSSISIGPLVDTDFGATLRSQTTSGGLARNLTFSSSTGNASLTTDIGSSGNVTFGVASGHAAGGGAIVLTSNLTITHNGTGELLFNRPLEGAGSLTKTGNGTFRYAPTVTPSSYNGTINLNQGRAIFAAVNGASDDFGATALFNLGGGTMEIRTTTALNKSMSTNMTVSAASTFAYNNIAATDQSLTIGTGTMVLNGNLTVQNISTSVAGNNIINITRNMTGSGNLIVATYNNVASGAVAFSNGRVQFSGDNTAWTGNLVVARGTAQFSGTKSFVPAAGSITLGTTGNATGAGLGFNQAATDANLANAITVTTGGVRLIRNNAGPGSSNNITVSGPVTLNGDLTLDHAGLGASQSITISGNVTGGGGLNVTYVGPHQLAGSSVRLTGTNTYTGATNVGSNATLDLEGSLTSNIAVAANANIGGDGSTTGSLNLASGARFVFSTTATLDVMGATTFDNSFNLASLVSASGGDVAWSSVSLGTYNLIGVTGSSLSNIGNFGFDNRAAIGDKVGYFQGATGLQLVVIPEASTWAIVGIGLFGMVVFHRLRRRSRGA